MLIEYEAIIFSILFTSIAPVPRERRVVGKGIYRVDKCRKGKTFVPGALSASYTS